MLQRCKAMLRSCAGFMWCLLTVFNVLLPRKRISNVINKKKAKTITQNSGEHNSGNVHYFRESWLLLLFPLGELVYMYCYSLIKVSLCLRAHLIDSAGQDCLQSAHHGHVWWGMLIYMLFACHWGAVIFILNWNLLFQGKKEIGFDRCFSLKGRSRRACQSGKASLISKS